MSEANDLDLWTRIIEYWKSCDLTIRPGVARGAITAFELRCSVSLPDDLAAYFLAVDGMEDDVDDALHRFWPLSDVQPVATELSDIHPDQFAYPDCFVFADHCISSWFYAVRITHNPNQPAPVFRVTGAEEPGEQMADSFVAFMERYVGDPMSIV